jgi:REP element-mobilizing transposase RayT
MGRPQRAIDPDSIYHVMCRGSDKKPIAWDARDFDSLFACLDRVARRHSWEVFAWCLMPNHYHVIVRTTLEGFSRGLQVLNQTHSIRTNLRYGKSAHLFRNRPHCVEVLSQAHLVNAILYVVRNPMRAGLCARAWEWPYSSYRATVGRAPAPPWFERELVLELFGGVTEFARLVHDEHDLVSDTDFAELPATNE